jgi:methylmalonyl-CoA epimerase
MIKKIDHIGIATAGISDVLSFWTEGMKLAEAHTEEVAEQKVMTSFLPCGDVNIELLEGTSSESPIAKFVEKKGPGIHHICFEVDDIRAVLTQLKEKGYQVIDNEPRIGAHGKLVAFVHPKSSGGILIELSQDQHERR